MFNIKSIFDNSCQIIDTIVEGFQKVRIHVIQGTRTVNEIHAEDEEDGDATWSSEEGEVRENDAGQIKGLEGGQ